MNASKILKTAGHYKELEKTVERMACEILGKDPKFLGGTVYFKETAWFDCQVDGDREIVKIEYPVLEARIKRDFTHLCVKVYNDKHGTNLEGISIWHTETYGSDVRLFESPDVSYLLKVWDIMLYSEKNLIPVCLFEDFLR